MKNEVGWGDIVKISLGVIVAIMIIIPGRPRSFNDYSAGRIMDDLVVYNDQAMSESEIQEFLSKKCSGEDCLSNKVINVPYRAKSAVCDEIIAGEWSAAEALLRVGTACKVNPQVIMAILQTKDRAITDPVEKEDLFSDIYAVAHDLSKYRFGPEKFVPFRENEISKGNEVCGKNKVFIENIGTAAIYGAFSDIREVNADDSYDETCNMYGRRDVWVFFRAWFGETAYAVSGEILREWQSFNTISGENMLGDPIGAMRCEEGICEQKFENGIITSGGEAGVEVTWKYDERAYE